MKSRYYLLQMHAVLLSGCILCLTCASSLAQVVVDFNYTGAVQTWIVPTCVNEIYIEAAGAAGGVEWPNFPARGGLSSGTLAVTPGQTLYINVGGKGLMAYDTVLSGGGFNGGGDARAGFAGGAFQIRGAGGGASDVRVGGNSLNDRVIVAGGGGGTGSFIFAGGDGGGLVANSGVGNYPLGGGGGGTQTAGGLGVCGSDGSFGYGGSAPADVRCGGGGGGWYGGGSGEGAGGGSGYIGGVTGAMTSLSNNDDDGFVMIQYTCPGNPPLILDNGLWGCDVNEYLNLTRTGAYESLVSRLDSIGTNSNSSCAAELSWRTPIFQDPDGISSVQIKFSSGSSAPSLLPNNITYKDTDPGGIPWSTNQANTIEVPPTEFYTGDCYGETIIEYIVTDSTGYTATCHAAVRVYDLPELNIAPGFWDQYSNRSLSACIQLLDTSNWQIIGPTVSNIGAIEIPVPTGGLITINAPRWNDILHCGNNSSLIVTATLGPAQIQLCEMSRTVLWRLEQSCHPSTAITYLQTISIFDRTPAILEFPLDTFECVSDVPAPLQYMPVGIPYLDDCDTGLADDIFWGQDTYSGTNCNSQLVRTYQAADFCGTGTTQYQYISIIDDKAPVYLGTSGALDHNIDLTSASACPINTGSWSIYNSNHPTYPISVTPVLGYYYAGNYSGPAFSDFDECNSIDQIYGMVQDPSLVNTCQQIREVHWFAVDECGNISSPVVQTFTFNLESSPEVLRLPQDITVDCGANNIDEYLDWIRNIGGAELGTHCADVNWSYNPLITNSACGQTWNAFVDFIAVDACGNLTTVSATFTVEDKTPPQITSPASAKVVECDGMGNISEYNDWLTSYAQAEAEDFCGNVSWSYEFISYTPHCGNSGSYRVDFIATDECGNSSKTTATFATEDNLAPQITKAAISKVVECDGMGNLTEYNDWLTSHAQAEAEDICSNFSWNHDVRSFTALCGNTGFYTVDFIAMDECDNSSITTATFTIEDTTVPEIVIPPVDITVQCNGAGNLVDYQKYLDIHAEAEAEDICNGIYWTYTDIYYPLCGNTGYYDILFRVTDNCDNYTEVSARFTIEDTESPIMDSEASDEIVECDGAGNQNTFNAWLLNQGGAIASDVCNDITWSDDYDPDHFVSICGQWVGYVDVIFTATDDCGNSTATSARFEIEDTTAPEITQGPSHITTECGPKATGEDMSSWLNAQAGAMAQDICSDVHWSFDLIDFRPGCSLTTGEWDWRFTARDDCGNAVTAQATYYKEDHTPPALVLPFEELTMDCAEQMNFGEAYAEDFCDQATAVVNYYDVVTELNCDYNYTVTRYYTATDACGNSSQTHQIIHMRDDLGPILIFSHPALDDFQDADTYILECDSDLIFNEMMVTCQDQCSKQDEIEVELELTTQFGNCILGSYKEQLNLEWIAWDACGNQSSLNLIVQYVDLTAPTFTSQLSDYSISCDQDLVFGMPDSDDNCGQTVLTYTDSQDGTDCISDTIKYTRLWTLTDDCGNTTIASQTIYQYTPASITGPQFTFVPESKTIACNADLLFGLPQAVSGCPGLNISHSDNILIGSCTEARVITRTWTAKDDCNQQVTAQQSITVIPDRTSPLISQVPESVTFNCDSPIDISEPVIEDACSNFELSIDDEYLDDPTSGTYRFRRTWTAIDDCGNIAFASQVFTIIDTQPPVFTTGLSDLEMTSWAYDAWTVPQMEARDNCSEVTVSTAMITEPGNLPNGYRYLLEWLATDLSGNVSTYSIKIKINDFIAKQKDQFENGNSMLGRALIEEDGDFTVYPNPFSHDVNLIFKSKKEGNLHILVTTIDGKQVYRKEDVYNKGENRFNIDLSGQMPGIYKLILYKDNRGKPLVETLYKSDED